MMQNKTKRIGARRLTLLAAMCLLLISAVLVSGVSAADSTTYFYVNSQTGSDSANGSSAASAVKTLTRAFELAGDRGGTIVLTNAYAADATVYETEHDAPFVITAKDATTDYGATGAKLVFGKALRYVMQGDTTFENITIEFGTTLNVVANYNHITFGDGVVTKDTGAGTQGVYVVGGYQSPADTVDLTKDSHITIRSGKFYIVAGGSRQKSTGAAGGLVYTGTHHIEVSGGEITRLYGGSIQHQIATAADITVTGGTIQDLYAAGDMTRRLQGDATIRLTGGKITNLYINNVVGAADVTLAGTEVKTVSVTYASDAIQNLATKASKPKTLHYDANYYTAAQLETFAGVFDQTENTTSIYAKEGATGSGVSASDPASFADAIKTAVRTQGSIFVLGTVNVKDLTEPAHAEAIVVKGADSNARLNISGTYTLGGETRFESLTVSASKATFRAENGLLTVAADVRLSGKPDVIGSAALYAGAFGSVKGGTADMHVIVGGAEIDSITGGTTAAKIEINSGKVGAVKSAATTIADFDLAVNGGEVGSVTFKSVTGKLNYILYGGKVGSYAVEGNNVKGTLNLNETLFKLADLGAAASIFTVSTEKVYYISDSGTGNGTSFSAAGNSMEDAYKMLAGGGTLVVCGETTLTGVNGKGAFAYQYNTGKITITSVYGDVDYRETNDAKLLFNVSFYCGGETEFSHINLVNRISGGAIYANLNKLVIGDDVACTYTASSTSAYLGIFGGTNNSIGVTDAEKRQTADVTVNSGTWQYVRGGSAAGGYNEFDIKLTINGGRFSERLVLVSANSHIGNVDATINGGSLLGGIYATTLDKSSQTVDGNLKLTINGGAPYAVVAAALNNTGTLKGSFDLYLNGGELGHITEIIGTADLRNCTMTSTLHTGDGVSLDAKVTGTMSFQNPIRTNGADPWLFYHDGNYYYIATASSALYLYRAANIGDLATAPYKTIYKPEEGKMWSKNLWSPEIHHYTDAEVGEGNGGWYCYIACDDGDNTNHRMYVIKCLDGDNLFGRWGNPVTGEVNVPQKIEAKDIPNFDNTWAAGQTDIKIGGQLYMMYVTEQGRGTANFYQTINIIKMTNPWTLEGQSHVICKPEYSWEKVGSADGVHPQVVEGGTAVYGKDGSIFIVYSGSGYWTTEYKLGQLKYLGGDPLDINSWEKLATPIFSKSNRINGCGHASYVTDTDGQTWICYHAYKGTTAQGGRYAFVEPYTATKDGVVIGEGTKHPADPDKIYTVNVNSTPLKERTHSFNLIEQADSKFTFSRDYKDNFTDVPANAWFYTYVRDAYRIGLANGTSATKFSPDTTFTVAQALTAAANIHTVYNGKTIDTAGAKNWYDPYVNYCIANGIVTATQFSDYNKNITRGDMAIVFANILPEEEYAAIRSGSNPDVTSDLACYAAVQKLYNAGIVGGDAGTGNYRPNDSIKRSEACVIFTRIALKSARAK